MSPTMPWGKFRGRCLTEIESSYLVWCLEKADSMTPSLRQAIRDELGTRYGRPAASSAPPPALPRKACPNSAVAVDIISAGLRTLSKKHHPDVGGDTAVMQTLNAVSDWLKALCLVKR